MSQYQYLVTLSAQPNGGYTATVPALPGCISEGNSRAKALKNIRDAIEGYLVVAVKRGLPLFSGYEEVQVVSGVLQNAKVAGC